MFVGSKQLIRAVMASALVPVFTVPPSVFAQAPEHVVSSSEMQNAAAAAAQTRQQNVDTLNRIFSSEKAEQALKGAKIDPQQVKAGIASLNDQELAQLSQRVNTAQQKFAAGSMSDHDLLVILIAVAVIILIIIAVR